MTTMTLAPTAVAQPDPYYAGRADAYDDAKTLTIDQMRARAGEYVDHADFMRSLGYMDRVLEFRMESAAVTGAETELAHVDLKADAVLDQRLAHTLAQELPARAA